jgi:SAM-dependent methyltransferase
MWQSRRVPLFASTIFAGAFLLFLVQPLIGKYILPWFGGGPGVWTTCMLFFQVLLVGGYGYAHFTSSRLRPRTQVVVHLILLAAALALLPIIPSDSWKPGGERDPTLQILLLLGACLGVPYFVLSSTGPLLQHWFSRVHPGQSPYRLYALSNAGSLLALVGYPFCFEPHFTRQSQARFWAWGLGVFVVGCAICSAQFWRASGSEEQARAGSDPLEATTPGTWLLWLLLPACASVLLLATTNKLCQDVAVIPFLWVLPLSIYLLSFIISFDSPRWYRRLPFTLALVAALAGFCWALISGFNAPIYKQVLVYACSLFVLCMVCHGELYRLRPDPSRLTGFYLMISVGGALGALFVAVLAPLLFTYYYEMHFGLLLCGLLFLLVCIRERDVRAQSAPENMMGKGRWTEWQWIACVLTALALLGLDGLVASLGARTVVLSKAWLLGMRTGIWVLVFLLVASWVVRGGYKACRHWRFLACFWLAAGWVALAVLLWTRARQPWVEVVSTSRNFYGVLSVFEHRRDNPENHHFLLQHGRITHGMQFISPQRAAWPTAYYGERSGIGLAINALPTGHRRLGLVGLGAGTLTAYALPGDYLRIYEINPEAKRYATTPFTFLKNCPATAKLEVVLGDARLSLEREPSQQFDLLALDAFSSDAIPVHLLTQEAFELYGRHLKPNGVIAVHISNHYLNLQPVLSSLASRFHYKISLVAYKETPEQWWLYDSTWVLLTRNEEFLKSPGIAQGVFPPDTGHTNGPLWTDDFASLFQILK